MEDHYFIVFPLVSFLMIGVGIAMKVYLKKTGLSDLRRVLGLGVFWVKFAANALIVIGIFCLLTVCVAFYFYLEYEGYIGGRTPLTIDIYNNHEVGGKMFSTERIFHLGLNIDLSKHRPSCLNELLIKFTLKESLMPDW